MTYFGRVVMLIYKQYLNVLWMKIDYLDIFLFHQPFLMNVYLLSSTALWKNIVSRPFTLGKTILNADEIVWVLYFSKTAELQCLFNTNIQLICSNDQI